jgi:hypothetical protein
VRVVVASWLAAAGTDGRVGSVLGDVEGLPGWFVFHISLVLPFVNCWIQAPEQPCGTVSAFQGKSGGAVGFLLACPAAAGKPRDPCSSLHLNHGWRKIEIPHSESFRVTRGLTH